MFSPKRFEVSFSNDGIAFSNSLSSKHSTKVNAKNSFIDTLTLHTKQKARFIKVNIKGIKKIPEGHPGVGNPGWIFIDEIIIN